MRQKFSYASSFLLKSIFVASLFVLIFISGVSYNHTVALTESSELVVHSYEVHLELDQLFSYVKDAEIGHHSFVISGDSVFLQPFNEARDKISKSFIKLIKLAADKKQQQANLDSLYELISLRLGQMANSFTHKAGTRMDQIQIDREMLWGRDVMNSIRTQINSMIALEAQYLNTQQQKYKYETLFTPLITLMLLIFSLTVFSFSYYRISNDLENLRETNKELMISTESIKHAEKIGEFSTWQWELETGKLVYSDNQYQLLGCQPQSFEPSLEKYLEFVHPDDRHIFTVGNDPEKINKDTSVAFYRIIRKDGQTRFFKSIGKLLKDSKGKRIMIGINCDVTDQHLSSIALEERNRELEQSNKELASFNHIASHDLQEPLRKVQTFISRILENDSDHFTETGKESFSKIQSAVGRMRMLIDDLLLFSRANKAEKIFQKSDLNQLLENAKAELAQRIEEKNAIINSTSLPELQVIPFQIQQLFINLIENSLKYSRPDVQIRIDISCEKTNLQNHPVFKSINNKQFYKITVSDNGLGFEQQYADSLFVLFYRLHPPNEYPGTGIGLAICKKIVENHSGFIEAKGQPGKGSSFMIYLPE